MTVNTSPQSQDLLENERSPGSEDRRLGSVATSPEEPAEWPPREAFIRAINTVTRQRAGNLLTTLFVSGAFALALLYFYFSILAFPNIPEPQDFIESWSGHNSFREGLREVLLEATLGVLALIGLTSITQIPGPTIDIDTLARHRVSQNIVLVATFGLAIYGWLTVPLNSKEFGTPLAWQGAAVVLIASAIAMLLSPDTMQRYSTLARLDRRQRRIDARLQEIRNRLLATPFEGRQPRRFQLWVTRQWREALKDSGYSKTYALRPKMSDRGILDLWPKLPYALPAALWGAWAFFNELALGSPPEIAWTVPAIISFLLFMSSVLLAVFHYITKWDAKIGSRWNQLPAKFSLVGISGLWLVSLLAIPRGSLTYFAGSAVFTVLAITYAFIGQRLKDSRILELERRYLNKKTTQITDHKNFLEEVEAVNQAGWST